MDSYNMEYMTEYHEVQVHRKHKGKYQKKGQTVQEEEDIHRFHYGLAIVEECHIVKNIGKGPWGILGQMKKDRPMNRF